MRSHLSLLSTLALLTFTAIGCTGVDSTDDASEAVGQAALRIDSDRGATSDTSDQTATTAVDKIGFGAAQTPDGGATTDENTDDAPALAGADKDGGSTDAAPAAPPQIDGVTLSMADGALTISIDASDPSGLPMSTSYSGFVVGSADGVTTFTVSALDIALAARRRRGPRDRHRDRRRDRRADGHGDLARRRGARRGIARRLGPGRAGERKQGHAVISAGPRAAPNRDLASLGHFRERRSTL